MAYSLHGGDGICACHFQKRFIGMEKAAFHVCPHHGDHHHGGDDQRRLVAADPQHQQDNEGCHGGCLDHREERCEKVAGEAGAGGQKSAEGADQRADHHSREDAQEREQDRFVKIKGAAQLDDADGYGERGGEEQLLPHRHRAKLPDQQPDQRDRHIFGYFFDHFK